MNKEMSYRQASSTAGGGCADRDGMDAAEGGVSVSGDGVTVWMHVFREWCLPLDIVIIRHTD